MLSQTVLLNCFLTATQICGNMRGRSSIGMRTGLTTIIKAGTTTTTPRRRYCLSGMPTTQTCVTACEPAGETWADFSLNEFLKFKMPTWQNKETTSCLLFYRCHQEYAYGPACTNSSTSSFAALPGQDYDQPLSRNAESALISVPPQYAAPPPFSYQTTTQGLVQSSGMGPDLWQYGEQHGGLSGVNPSATDESNTRNINPGKEFSIRIISVWGHITQKMITISQEHVYWPNMYNSVNFISLDYVK